MSKELTWEELDTMLEGMQSGGKYIRLANDGDSVVGVFLGQPYARSVVWTGAGYDDYDPGLHDADQCKTRIQLNFYVLDEDRVGIYETSAFAFKEALVSIKKYGRDKVFEIKRNGKKGDQKTTYSVLPEPVELSKEQQDAIAMATLHDLSSDGKEADKPLDDSQRESLAKRLKPLGAERVKAILTEIGVKKLSELMTSHADRLMELILAAEKGESANDGEVDPFA